MKRTIMQNRSLGSASILPVLVVALALLVACQPPPEANNNAGGANSSNTSTTSSSSGYIDLVGEWKGQSGGQPSTLIITNHMGDTFSGTKTVGEYQVAVAGVVDLKTREITIRETNVIKGKSDYPLGLGTGLIAPNGREMSGEWKTKGSASSFSFSK